MEIKASAKYLRASPRKVRLVARAVAGLPPSEALNRLSLLPKRASVLVAKVIKQAVANGENNFKINPEEYIIGEIRVGEGPRMKKIDKSHGARFDGGIIRKKFCHLWVVLKGKRKDGNDKKDMKDMKDKKDKGGIKKENGK